jgi:hypothetical protein
MLTTANTFRLGIMRSARFACRLTAESQSSQPPKSISVCFSSLADVLQNMLELRNKILFLILSIVAVLPISSVSSNPTL